MTQQQPRPGDTVRVVRTITTTEVYEGIWVVADDRSPTGNHAIESADGTWRRVRDQGPAVFGDGGGGTYTETDTIEVVTARDATPETVTETDTTAAPSRPRARGRRRHQRRDWRG